MMMTSYGRWTTTKAALAVAGALAIAGAVGSAIAMSPIVQPPIKWAGGAEFVYGSVSGAFAAYTVPAGRSLILTDLVIGNTSGEPAVVTITQGTGNICLGDPPRMQGIVAPNGETTIVSLQTGIGFPAGQSVCIHTATTININGRGFLFTPVPAG